MEGSTLLKLFTKQIWILGVNVTVYLVFYITIIILLIQMGWLAYRYVTDAAKKHDNAAKKYDKFRNRDRIIFCGDFLANSLPNPIPGSQTFSDDLGKFFGVVFIYFICGVVSALVWPLLLVCATGHGALFGLRAVLRFKKKINEALDSKAEKYHDHDDLYARK